MPGDSGVTSSSTSLTSTPEHAGLQSRADHADRAADNVQSLAIPGCGHHPPEETPEETLAALTAFLAPYRDEHAATHNPGPPGASG